MSKELEALENIKWCWDCDISKVEEDFDVIETALKALEIIKNKLDANTICRVFGFKGYDIIKYFTDDDLLKEILGNDKANV